MPTQIRTLVCRFTGAIMRLEACCPSDLEEKTAPVAQLLGESCCLAKVVDLPKLLSDHQPDGSPTLHEQALAAGPTVEVLVPVVRWTPFHAVRPPPHGPPLILLKRSFLI
ncbi:MAG TPA: hypothetical protein VHO06_16395 [Polyangia bacterium]|nr:hypothetical protein [Polyangia bacterium]